MAGLSVPIPRIIYAKKYILFALFDIYNLFWYNYSGVND